ncbi:MAG: peptide ABC transporter substrate-binding protein [Pseudomonadota bacterium]
MRSFLLALIFLLSCTTVWAQTLAREQVLHKGNGPEPEALDPHRAEGVNTSNILRDLFEGLTSEAPDGRVIPGAAQSWELSEDGKTYTFHLRENARWSNGDAVTAADFVYSLQRSADPATASNYSSILEPIENAAEVTTGKLPPSRLAVSAPDAHTLVIRLRAVTPYFLGLLNHASTYPVHRPSIEKYGARAFRAENIVGNGAYKAAEWVVQSHVLLVRNRQYWDDAHTTIERVYYHATEDLSSEFKRYRAGEIDWTESVPVTQVRWIRKNIPQEFRVSPYLGVYYYGLNLTQPPFKNNPKLRRALSLAIDRDVIVKKVIGTGELPAYSWVPPIPGYKQQAAEWATWPREKRLAEARRLYAEAGYSAANPLEVEIRYNTSEDHKKIALVVAAMWKQYLGAKTRLVNQEFKVFLRDRTQKKITQAFRSGWIGDFNDPYTFSELLYSQNGRNDMGYVNANYDSLLEQAAHEIDAATRMQYLEQAERLMLEDQPMIPLYFYVNKRLAKPYVVGWQGNIMDHHYTKNMKILAH